MITIGVVSDTHLSGREQKLPQALVEGLKGVSMIIHAGDLIDPVVLEQLKKIAKDVVAVRGNMDQANLAGLPEKQVINIGKFKFAVMHGCGAPAGLVELMGKVFKEDSPDAIIFGHSHQPMNEKIGKTLYFNPGSPTDKVYAAYNSYGIIEVGDKIEAKIIRI